jgi:trk system potassium uptake protein
MTVSRTICLGFIAVILAGALLLMLPISVTTGGWGDPLVALFTSTSAVCVTGHVVVDTATYFSSFGQAAIAALIQIGGLGYMSVTTFLLLLLGRKFGLKDKVALQQALDREGMQGVAGVLRSIISATAVIELTGVILLFLTFLPQYGPGRSLSLAFFHSISAFNNAGFALFSDNLASYPTSWPINLIITSLIIVGGIGYEVMFEFYLWTRDRYRHQLKRSVFSLNFKVAVSTTAILLLGGTLAIFFTERINPETLGKLNLQGQFLAAWFQSVTARTAGFNTIDIGKMSQASLCILIALMFIGGSPGGTAGGIKTTTLRVLTSCTKAILQGKEEATLYQRQIPLNLVLKSVGVFMGSLATVVVITVLIAIAEPGVAFLRILFEVVSAFGTVGLSTGITAGLTAFSKLVLIATMYIGRVGVLLLMSAILGDPSPSRIHYPEENLLVG